MDVIRKNRTLLITLAILLVLLLMAIQGLDTKDWIVTLLRALAVGAITFLVASGLSLIFGLLDVLNLAHGTLFMIGAYAGWTVYVRPDSFVDLMPVLLLLAAGLLLQPLLQRVLGRLRLPAIVARVWPFVTLLVAAGLVIWVLSGWPVAKWDLDIPSASPANDALQLDLAMGANQPRPTPEAAQAAGVVPLIGALVAGTLVAASLAGFSSRGPGAGSRVGRPVEFSWRVILPTLIALLLGVGLYLGNEQVTQQLQAMSTSWMFFLAILVALVTGFLLGGLMEVTLIRPLYARPIYQLMLTLGLGVSGIELVQAIWGRPEFTIPKPALFRGSGAGCPATSLGELFRNQCSILTIEIQDQVARIRFYNEIFVILVGLVVLVVVWLLLQRSRLGMVIRAGVQDSEMVEALGINVRQVFTLVFALGTGLAALGGIIAAPSMGLSPLMGESLLLQALIALAIGGLTSFPGAAAGSILVGLLQQFIIKYGQIGITLPFLAEPFKPTPPLVPASTVLLMVIILLILPQGLFGRKE